MNSIHIFGKDRVKGRRIPKDDAFTNAFYFKARNNGEGLKHSVMVGTCSQIGQHALNMRFQIF